VGSAITIVNALITYLFVNPMGHDGLEKEDQAFREHLESHGYDTSRMGLSGIDEVTSVDEKIDHEESPNGSEV